MILITVTHTQGSVPREAGTWMVVTDQSTMGTLGGGNVEFQAIAHARSQSALVDTPKRYALGPTLGQCCGGVMELAFASIDPADLQTKLQKQRAAYPPVAVFGGGHVGRAITTVLAALPFQVTWIDSRDGVFPTDVHPNILCEHSEPVEGAVANLAPATRVLIMSFSHAEDLDIVQACLRRQRKSSDLPWIGVIGSKTKWATFQHRLRERGFTSGELAHITCPIGIEGIDGKEPEVIAIAVAAQLIMH
jgi:xanthine dehydrogenase accessory factor